ncbi:hypothetical protein Syun_027894 [Stephania yunnanensis]|uniref:Uncharacterized protein n=1 Tax=Stephania yunnanensis TaxID=152371 RepID=A0AAP0HLF7_9MAGN
MTILKERTLVTIDMILFQTLHREEGALIALTRKAKKRRRKESEKVDMTSATTTEWRVYKSLEPLFNVIVSSYLIYLY